MIVFDMLIRLVHNIVKFIVIYTILSFYSLSLGNADLEIEIDNPIFSEKGLDNRLYEIKADRGIQRETSLELFTVEGKLRSASGIWVYLNAKKGSFDQIKNEIELSGEITFYTDENDRFYSDFALFSIESDLIKFNRNVKHIKGNSIITSDESRIKNNFEHIIYEGNVRTLYVIE